jgi:hypothetical protein
LPDSSRLTGGEIMRKALALSTAFGLCLALKVSVSGAAGIAERPDFSGSWKLDLEASRLQIPSPDSGVFRIDHREPDFRLSRTFVRNGKEDTWSVDLTTDGKDKVQEDSAEVFRGCLTWEGNDLVLDSTITAGGRTASNVVRYHLSEDGRTLTATETFRGPRLKYNNVWVFKKESEARVRRP